MYNLSSSNNFFITYLVHMVNLKVTFHLQLTTVYSLFSTLFVVRYIPSAKECPLLLQLPDGEISKTNGFISPVSCHSVHHLYTEQFLMIFLVNSLMLLNFNDEHVEDVGRHNCLEPPRMWEEFRECASCQAYYFTSG